jgi:hypothetical protein
MTVSYSCMAALHDWYSYLMQLRQPRFISCPGYSDGHILNPNTHYSRWPPRAVINFVRRTLNIFHAFIDFLFLTEFLTYRAVILPHISLVFTLPDHVNQITGCYSLVHLLVLNALRYYHCSKRQVSANEERFVLLIFDSCFSTVNILYLLE